MAVEQLPSFYFAEKMTDFAQKLIEWHHQHPRPMPWQGERNPYKIWLSEIILQQTRVEQGLPYFLKFIEKYPTVQHLAAAPLDEVLKLWQGLGYYARCRNLHETARHIAENLGGNFPENYAALRQLKGVGDYTAAAIASFAFNLPHAVLDGNVFRVLARTEGIETAIDTPQGKKLFAELAQKKMGNAPPALYNQAIMNFGAMQCLPQQPVCTNCPLQTHCRAYHNNMVSVFPRKSKVMQKKHRYFLYFDIRHGENTWLRQRTEKDIWQGLYEFPKMEVQALPTDFSNLKNEIAQLFFGGNSQNFELENISTPHRQTLTHREVIAIFIKIRAAATPQLDKMSAPPTSNYIKVKFIELKKIYPLPKIIHTYLQEGLVLLSL